MKAPWYPSTRLSSSLVRHTRNVTTTVDAAERMGGAGLWSILRFRSGSLWRVSCYTFLSGCARSGGELEAPFRVFGDVARRETLPYSPTSSRNSRLVQSLSPTGYRPHWFGEPALPLAVSSAVRVSARRTALVTVRWPVQPLFEFRVPPESCPTSPSRTAAAVDTSHGL
jgi:hypothetical protein